MRHLRLPVLLALTLGAATAWLSTAQAASPPTGDARIQRIDDHIAIERLLLDYGRTLDARDFRAYSDLFAKEGEWKGGFGTFRGPAAIKEAMEKTFRNAAGDIPKGSNFHIMSNFIIDVQGDRATARSYFIFYKLDKNKPVPEIAGRYEDTLIRENGAWKFLLRNALPAD